MEDAQVGDWELPVQVTTERNKGTRTTAVTIQIDPGSLRTARITSSAKT